MSFAPFTAGLEGTSSGRPATMSRTAVLPPWWSWMASLAPCACTRLARSWNPGRKASSEMATWFGLQAPAGQETPPTPTISIPAPPRARSS